MTERVFVREAVVRRLRMRLRDPDAGAERFDTLIGDAATYRSADLAARVDRLAVCQCLRLRCCH